MYKIADWVVFILLAIIGIIDARKREIPMRILILMSVVISVSAMFCKNVNVWYRIAGAIFGGAFFIISKVTKEAVGYGDSWMILLLGVHLGIWKALQLLFTASVLAAIFAIFYLWKRRWKRSATLPFAPFLAIAYIGVMFG